MGVDIGTTNIKCVVVDPWSGRVLESQSVKTPVYMRGDVSEFDADVVWEKTLECMGYLKLRGSVGVIGLSGQSPSLVLLGRDGKPVYKGLSWADKRAKDQALKARGYGEWLLGLTGLHIDPIFTLFKLKWVKERLPEVYEKADLVLQVKDYVFFRLTGVFLTDHSSASETMMYDLRKGWWSRDIIEVFGLDMSKLPEIVESETIVEPRNPLPVLDRSIPVCVGGVDSVMAAFGCGSGERTPSVSAGTSICVNLVMSSLELGLVRRSFEIYRHVEKGRWTAECSTPSGGLLLEWARRILGYSTLEEMFRDALRSPPGANGVVLEPYLIGSRCPSWAAKKAAFRNLTMDVDRGDIARAVIESVSAWITLALKSSGLEFREVMFSGGLSGSPVPAMVSDLTRRPVRVFGGVPAEAYGAALLGGVASGRIDRERVRGIARSMCNTARSLGLAEEEADHILNVYRGVLGFTSV
jgi:gluconokinase